MGTGIGIDPGKPINGLIPGGARPLPASIEVKDWATGLEYQAWSSHKPSRWYSATCRITGVDQSSNEKTLDATSETPTFFPFDVYSLRGCETADLHDAEYKTMAELSLISGLSYEFAKEITLGNFSGSPSFKSVAIPISLSATSDYPAAIRQLKKARVKAGHVGVSVYHAPVWLLPEFASLNLVEPRLDGLYVPGSNDRWSFDYYEGFTPDLDTAGDANGGTASGAGTSYVTITGPVEYGLGEIKATVAEGIKMKQTNHVAVEVRQAGIFRFDTTGVYTVLITE